MKSLYNKKMVRRITITALVVGIALGVCLSTLLNKVFAVEEVKTPEPIVIVESQVIEEPAQVEGEPKYYDCPLDNDLQDYIRELCVQNNLPMSLVIAIIENESSFVADVISPDGGDYGLMQINKINHKWLSEKYGITNFLNPYQNVLCGINILADQCNKYGDYHKALMAYNMGAGGANRLWKQGIYTSKYSEKVMRSYDKYERS